jgi:hypothetical protein
MLTFMSLTFLLLLNKSVPVESNGIAKSPCT